TAVLESQLGSFESLGCVIDDAVPDFAGADEAFHVWRAWVFAVSYGPLLETHRDQIKETVIWNTEAGKKLTGPQIGQAEMKRSALCHRVREFMEEYAFMILRVTQVPPVDVNQEYVTEINGVAMETYIDRMKSCYYITVTGLPAISVPCGF